MKHTSWPAGLRTMFIFNYYKKHCYKNTLLYGSPWTICIFHLLYIKSLEYTFSCWPENNVYFSTIIKESSWSKPIYCTVYMAVREQLSFFTDYTLWSGSTHLCLLALKKVYFLKIIKKLLKTHNTLLYVSPWTFFYFLSFVHFIVGVHIFMGARR